MDNASKTSGAMHKDASGKAAGVRPRAEVYLTEAEKKAVMLQGYEDPEWFCGFYFPHLFPTAMPPFHLAIAAIITKRTDFLLKHTDEAITWIERNFIQREDPNPNVKCREWPIFVVERNDEGKAIAIHLDIKKFTVIMVPRGFSKTTLIGIALVLWEILYKVHDFIVYLSETASHAERQLDNVKKELETNERIHLIFGKIKPPEKGGLKWAADEIQTTTDIVVVAKGRGGQVRGLNSRGKRPNRILIDDVEDKESVKTEERRVSTRDWLYADVIPALPLLDDTAGIVALGTLLHSESLLMTIMRDKMWTSVRLAALDREGNPLWPLAADHGKLAQLRESFATAGRINSFNMEYMSVITSDADSKFKRDNIKYTPTMPSECVAIALALDPAISTAERACSSSIAVVGMKPNGRLTVLDFWSKVGASPREQIDVYFEMRRTWKTTVQGVEANAYQAALIHIMREEMFRKSKEMGSAAYFEIEKITHAQKKEERIEGILQPRYAAGYIEHNRVFPQLESELLDYPNGKVDGPDVVAMAVALLDPYAAYGAMGDGSDLGDDEAEDLDEVMNGDWRSY